MTLWTDPAARQAAVTAAQHYMDTHPNAAADDIRAQMKAAKEEMSQFPMPIGWTDPDGKKSPWQVFHDRITNLNLSDIWTLIGWLITGLAASLGAPFWFDTLKDLLGLRNTGPKPARAAAAAVGETP